MPPYKKESHEQNVARARKSLSEKSITEAWTTGRLMPVDAAIEMALQDLGRHAAAHGGGMVGPTFYSASERQRC